MSDSPNDNDSLGSSFVSSFSLPPPSPAQEPKPSATGQTDATDVEQLIISQDENTNAEAPDPLVAAHSETTVGVSDDPSAVTNPAATESLAGEDWKSTLDKNLEGWRAESAEARAKSESTRLRLEEEAARERKRVEDEQKAERERLKREAEDAEVERKVKELLEGKKGKGHAAAHHHHHHHEGMDERRWNAVRSAWEVAQTGSRVAPVAPERSEFEEEEPVEVDGRDMVAGDHGGRDGNKAAEVLQKLSQATEAVTHSDGNLNPTPASATRRADLLSASSRAKPSNEREAVADAWRANAQKSAEEKGAGEASGQKHPAAAAGEKKVQQAAGVSRPSDANEDSSRATPSQPEQPPSLTLSLFTSRLTPARIAAVVGINVVLPFINGVMLGFGEIFARECIRVVRGVWRGERGWRIGGWGGVAGVGLREGARAVDMSGSGSFP
ncbi:hypothetical protein NliqN6_2832 [Naganishia liquefaciens]|uniref:Uncharacterized protein n=1 Tax=Naganishia liquefaciens TaxID=104408 RepID=A0A8H3TTL1_9TREE|nr:hypothetical protein NliqN6_2832 [Naganishia liquefaciens]